jgi:hypothetical protein
VLLVDERECDPEPFAAPANASVFVRAGCAPALIEELSGLGSRRRLDTG